MIDYDGAVALVTGAGSGIGRALAQALAARGARVVLADVDAAGVEAAAGALGARGHAVVCDLPERCAEIALNGLDLGLFYIPTHAHLADDMRPRTDGVAAALKALGLAR